MVKLKAVPREGSAFAEKFIQSCFKEIEIEIKGHINFKHSCYI